MRTFKYFYICKYQTFILKVPLNFLYQDFYLELQFCARECVCVVVRAHVFLTLN